MKYPKPLMGVSELVEMGFSREQLKRYLRIEGCPATKTPGGGKWKFDTEKFEEWRTSLKF